jgi:hypothetical protein
VLIGLSPKVVAHYFTDGADDETAQWYAISTVHPGGNIAYGTSQDVNNIYMKWYVTGTTVADTVDNVPAERDAVVDADTGLGGGWTDLEWSLTPPMGPPE